MTPTTYHREEVVIALDLGGDLGELLVESVRDVVSWISGDDEDALSDSSKLYGQTTAGQTIEKVLVVQMVHCNSLDHDRLRYEQTFKSYNDVYLNSKYFKCLILNANLTAGDS